MNKNISRKIRSVFDHVVRIEQLGAECYAGALQRHPFVFLFASGAVAVVLTILGVVYGPTPTLDPLKGAETRGTTLSNNRLMWHHLLNNRDRGDRLDKTKMYSRVAEYTPGVRSRAMDGFSKAVPNTKWLHLYNEKPSDSPCDQLQTRSQYMPYLSQIVLKVKSVHDLFSMETIKEMCRFELELRPLIERFLAATPYRHMWTLSNYAACYSKAPIRNCSFVTETDVKTMREKVQYCSSHHGSEITECAYEALYGVHKHIAPDYHVQYAHCAKVHGISANCTELEKGIIYNLLSHGALQNWDEPMYINIYLPMFGQMFYKYGGGGVLKVRNVSLPSVADYLSIKSTVENFWKDNKKLKVVAMDFGIKIDTFISTLKSDSVFGLLAFALIFALLLAISGSLFYTLMVALSIIFSVGVAFFLYGVVFGIYFFPTMNQMVLVLLIGIGADDTFILRHILKKARKPISEEETDNEDSMSTDLIDPAGFRLAFSHAALAMFVTSATTAASFCASIFSNLITTKCFGVFAGTTMVVNYVLAVTWLPAAHLIVDTHILPLWQKYAGPYLGACTRCCQQMAFPGRKLLHEWLPWLVEKFDVVIVAVFSLGVVASCCIAFVAPGMKVPNSNPDKLLVSSHPFEWYDDHAHALFPAIRHRYETQMNFSLLWGFKPVTDASNYVPEQNGTLQRDYTFALNNSRALWELRHICQELTLMYSIGHKFDCWTDRFWEWSSKQKCGDKHQSCCNITSPSFDWKHLNTCMVEASKQMPRPFFGLDHPIFLNNQNVLVGYLITIVTDHMSDLTYAKTKAMLDDVTSRVEVIAGRKRDPVLRNYILTAEIPAHTQHFDLRHSLLCGTPVAILFSTLLALAVLIVSTRAIYLSLLSIVSVAGIITATLATVVLMGWTIRIAEATLIVLVVGLSFDYTLHYAVAYKVVTNRMKYGDESVDAIRESFESIALPVAHSALTTLVAGLALLPAGTKLLHQTGVFMCLITIYGWIYSSLFFMALLSMLERQNICQLIKQSMKKLCATEDGMEDSIIPSDNNNNMQSNNTVLEQNETYSDNL